MLSRLFMSKTRWVVVVGSKTDHITTDDDETSIDECSEAETKCDIDSTVSGKTLAADVIMGESKKEVSASVC